ncbi:MAG TPA: tetratricopeptide repeat protein [Alloacidobacterium sp.]|nr:tetratricopeptide repeat protein [Alloacidobacterium sp.]
MVLLYGSCICGSFIYDDISHIQQNPALVSWKGAFHYFRTSDAFAHDLLPGGGSSYRPLLWLSLALDRHLWGLQPCGFHITNLLLHWISGSLYFILLRRMRAPTLLAAAVCLLWLGLPINSEAVAWISGRTYPLMCIFLVSSLLAADSYLTKGSTPALFLYTAGLLAALLSNEEGILVLPLTILLAYFKEKTPQRRWLSLGVAGAVATAGYFVLRRLAVAHMPSGPASFLMLGTAFFKYVMWILFPVHMSVERSTDTPANSLSLASIAALTGMFCFLMLLYWFRKRNALIVFGLTWMAITLLPFCGIVSLYQGMAERYVYLASFGLVLAIIAAAWHTSTPKRFVMFALIVLWGFWGARRLEARASEWKDPVSLYQSSLETTPGSTKLTYNLGTAFEASGNFYKASEYYHKALELNPKYVPAMVGLGNLDQRTGNMAKAEQEYRQAASMDPSDGNVRCYLGALLFREGKIAPAIQELSQAVAMNPSNSTAYLDLGVIYQKSGDPERAAQMYAKVLALQPGDPEALTDLQTLRSME